MTVLRILVRTEECVQIRWIPLNVPAHRDLQETHVVQVSSNFKKLRDFDVFWFIHAHFSKVFKKLFHYHFYCFDRFYFILMTSFSLLQHESYIIDIVWIEKNLLLYHWSQFVLSNTIFCQILWKCRCILVTFTSHWKK